MLKDVVIAGKTYVKMNVSDEAVMDRIAAKVIRKDIPEFLLPVKIIHVNGETEIRYEMSEGIRLSYLSEKMSKKEFLVLMEYMIRPFQTCNDWFLNYHKFYLDTDYIIVGKNSTSVRYIYRFDEEYMRTDEQILEFFREFLLNINLIDDKQFIFNLYRRTKEKNITLTSFFENIIRENSLLKNVFTGESSQEKEQERKFQIDITGIRENISSSLEKKIVEVRKEKPGNPIEKEKPPVDSFGKSNEKAELIGRLFGEEEESEKKPWSGKKVKEKKKTEGAAEKKEHKKLLSGIFGSKKADKKESEAKENITFEKASISTSKEESRHDFRQSGRKDAGKSEEFQTEEDQTEFDQTEDRKASGAELRLELEEDRGFQCPKYFEINLQKGYATLGRYDKAGYPQADYNFEASLSFISRVHCRFGKEDGQIFIIDLGSRNGTLVNDVALAANMPVPIQRGDRISFSKNNRITYRVC